MSLAPTQLKTSRLAADRLSGDHYDRLCALHLDASVMATLGGVRSAQETKRYLDSNLAHWDRHGHGLWVLRARDSGRFAGRAGLRHVELAGADEVELAYTLAAEFWGRGLATEIGRALIDVAFGPLDLPDLVCFTLIDNWRSRRVMEKLGFADPRALDYDGAPCVLYRLTRA